MTVLTETLFYSKSELMFSLLKLLPLLEDVNTTQQLSVIRLPVLLV